MARRDDNVWARVARYSGLGLLLPVSTVMGYLAGWGLDKLFHTHFLWLVFLGLGAVAGFIEMIREVRQDLGP